MFLTTKTPPPHQIKHEAHVSQCSTFHTPGSNHNFCKFIIKTHNSRKNVLHQPLGTHALFSAEWIASPTSLPFYPSQTNRPGQFAALWSTELQKEHLFFLFGCNSSADLIRLDFACPLVVDLGGSLGTPAIGAATWHWCRINKDSCTTIRRWHMSTSCCWRGATPWMSRQFGLLFLALVEMVKICARRFYVFLQNCSSSI